MPLDLEKYRKPTTTPPTSTGVNLEKYRKPPVEQPKKDGFFKSLVKDAAETLLVKPAARTAELVGRTGVLGQNIKRGYEEMSKTGEGQRIFGIDVEAQKALGQGGAKQIGGEALKGLSWLYGGGKAAQVGGATLKGQMLRGFIQGAKGGAVGGAAYGAGTEMQQEGSTTGSILKEGAVGGAVGLATGGVVGGLLPVPVAAIKGTKNALNPAATMQRVARVNALDQQKFQQTAKESIGEYLVKRGIYGNDEEIMVQLADRFSKSKAAADEALMKLPGTYRPQPVKTALTDMLEREIRISSPGAPSRDLAKVSQLAQKYDSQGLTMTEINEVKRIFERNNKLDYLKQNLPESIAKANTLDDAIRTWQFNTAEKLGLKNLAELNRETRLAKQLGDALFKKNVRGSGNNELSLTDAVLLSGGDTQAVSMLIARKIGGSKKLQSAIAKRMAGEPTVGLPKAIFGPQNQSSSAIPPVVLPRATNQNLLDMRVNPGAATPELGQLEPQSRQTKTPLPKTILPVREVSSRGRGEVKIPQNKEMFAGAAMGFEQDENGEWVFNEEKALAGLVGVAGLSRSKAIQKLSKDLDTTSRKVMINFINAVRLNMKSGKSGQFTFKNTESMTAQEAEKAFDRGLQFIQGAAGEGLENKKIQQSLPNTLANFYEDVVSSAKNSTALGKAQPNNRDN